MFSIILENEMGKLVSVLTKYDLDKANIFIARSSIAAERMFLHALATPIDLYVDYELDPGCGNGLSFLEEILPKYHALVNKVIITSFSNECAKAMARRCDMHGVGWEYMRP